MGIFTQRRRPSRWSPVGYSPTQASERVKRAISETRDSIRSEITRAGNFLEPAGRTMFNNMARRGEELVTGAENLVRMPVRSARSQAEIGHYILHPEAPGAKQRALAAEKTLVQMPVELAAGALQGVTERLKRVGAAGWIIIDGDRMNNASRTIADCLANPGQPNAREKLLGAVRELSQPQTVRLKDKNEFAKVMNAYLDVALDGPQLVLDAAGARGLLRGRLGKLGRGGTKRVSPRPKPQPRSRIGDPSVDTNARTQPDLRPLSPKRLSSAEHDAVLKEMLELQKARKAWDAEGDPTPRYRELGDKIERHVEAAPRGSGDSRGTKVRLGDSTVDPNARTLSGLPVNPLATTQSRLATSRFAQHAKNLTGPLQQRAAQLRQSQLTAQLQQNRQAAAAARPMSRFAQQAQNLARPLLDQASRLQQNRQAATPRPRSRMARHATSLTRPLLQGASRLQQNRQPDSQRPSSRFAQQATKLTQPLLQKASQLQQNRQRFAQHTIRKGDTLWGIAKTNYGSGRHYQRIVKANPQIKNPNLIYPGQVLKIPRPRR